MIILVHRTEHISFVDPHWIKSQTGSGPRQAELDNTQKEDQAYGEEKDRSDNTAGSVVNGEVVLTVWTSTTHHEHCDTEVSHGFHSSVRDILTLGLLRNNHLRLRRGLGSKPRMVALWIYPSRRSRTRRALLLGIVGHDLLVVRIALRVTGILGGGITVS
jgi:hypothetical protein